MGISTTGAALKCFNGPKMWRTEWFTSNSLQTNPEGQQDIAAGATWSGRLVGTHDYFNSCYDDSTERTVLRAGDVYVWFNRIEAFTANAGGFNCLTLGGNCDNDSDKRDNYENLVLVSQQSTVTTNTQALLPLDFHVDVGKSLRITFWCSVLLLNIKILTF